ncbi:hypothetical protein [Rhodophyticola sp.]|jgi:hypothetical protein|uniref:hypothetical protein n=1 Tax=Rhodophyticola sp. TaxID=2680032 RepID=UPI003D270CCF
MTVTEQQLEDVDLYLARKDKQLTEPQPEWVDTGREDYQCTWSIIEMETGVERSTLKLRIPFASFENPSVGLIFRGNPIARLDRARDSVCEGNPPYATRLGLPYRVCGPHLHSWEHNRHHVALTGLWELPARVPITDNMSRLNQMFFWFCDKFSLMIPNNCRQLHLPDRGLFGDPNA